MSIQDGLHFRKTCILTNSRLNLKQCQILGGLVKCVSAIKSRFECLIKFLRHVDNTDDNRERALVTRNVLDQIDQKFIYCMLLMHDLLLEAKGASDTLQSPKLNFLEAADLIESKKIT